MIPAGALSAWHQRQTELLSRHYDEAWARGVAAYEPDDDPPEGAHLDAQHAEHDAAAGALAVAFARTRQKYVPPSEPDPDRKRKTLAPSITSLDKMVSEVRDVVTSPQRAPGGQETSPAAAVAAWAASNAYRLAGGVGQAVWGGEQAGFAQAASKDGMLLIWICQEDEGSCPDCLELADLPAAAETDWPTLPGGGGTACNGNCRCTMDYAPPGYS